MFIRVIRVIVWCYYITPSTHATSSSTWTCTQRPSTSTWTIASSTTTSMLSSSRLQAIAGPKSTGWQRTTSCLRCRDWCLLVNYNKTVNYTSITRQLLFNSILSILHVKKRQIHVKYILSILSCQQRDRYTQIYSPIPDYWLCKHK